MFEVDILGQDIVWSEAKQSGLIDSILRNFYIPPVLFGELQAYSTSTQPPDCKDSGDEP